MTIMIISLNLSIGSRPSFRLTWLRLGHPMMMMIMKMKMGASPLFRPSPLLPPQLRPLHHMFLSKKIGKFPSSPKKDSSLPSASPSPSPLQTISLVRSRSDGDIETFSVITKQRKEELLGTISKQRLTRTSSWTFSTRICRLNLQVQEKIE